MDKKAAIIAIIVGLIGFVNVVCEVFGFPLIPIDETMVTTVVSFVFILIGWFGASYKNLNLTAAAKKGQEVTDAIKAGEAVKLNIKAEKKD